MFGCVFFIKIDENLNLSGCPLPPWIAGGYLQKNTPQRSISVYFSGGQAIWEGSGHNSSRAAEGPGDSPSHPQTRPVELSASRNALQQRHRSLTLGQKICWDAHPTWQVDIMSSCCWDVIRVCMYVCMYVYIYICL